jgi:hypothetical protein
MTDFQERLLDENCITNEETGKTEPAVETDQLTSLEKINLRELRESFRLQRVIKEKFDQQYNIESWFSETRIDVSTDNFIGSVNTYNPEVNIQKRCQTIDTSNIETFEDFQKMKQKFDKEEEYVKQLLVNMAMIYFSEG